MSAYAEVEIEANTLEEAGLPVQEDIHKLGVNSDVGWYSTRCGVAGSDCRHVNL